MSEQGMISSIEKLATALKANDPDIIIQTQASDAESGKQFIIIIITGLMRRVHCLQTAKHVSFVDTTSCVDQTNSALTVVLSPSQAGALPLGSYICAHEY